MTTNGQISYFDNYNKEFEEALINKLNQKFEHLAQDQKQVLQSAKQALESAMNKRDYFDPINLGEHERAIFESGKEALWNTLNHHEKECLLNLRYLPDQQLSKQQRIFLTFAVPSNLKMRSQNQGEESADGGSSSSVSANLPPPAPSGKPKSLFTRFFRLLLAIGAVTGVLMYRSGVSKLNSLLTGLLTFVVGSYLLTRLGNPSTSAAEKKKKNTTNGAEAKSQAQGEQKLENPPNQFNQASTNRPFNENEDDPDHTNHTLYYFNSLLPTASSPNRSFINSNQDTQSQSSYSPFTRFI